MENIKQNDEVEVVDKEKERIIDRINRDGITKTWHNESPRDMIVGIFLSVLPLVCVVIAVVLFAVTISQFIEWRGGDPLEGILKYDKLISQWKTMIVFMGVLMCVESIVSIIRSIYNKKMLYAWINNTGIDCPRFIMDGVARSDNSRKFATTANTMYYAKNPPNYMMIAIPEIIFMAVWILFTVTCNNDLLKAANEVLTGVGSGKLYIETFFAEQGFIWFAVLLIILVIIIIVVFVTVGNKNNKAVEWAKQQIKD